MCRLEDTGHHPTDAPITAHAGEHADACCIIHGYSDGEIGNKLRPPLSASFYANSFLPDGQNRFDLSKLATKFDPHEIVKRLWLQNTTARCRSKSVNVVGDVG